MFSRAPVRSVDPVAGTDSMYDLPSTFKQAPRSYSTKPPKRDLRAMWMFPGTPGKGMKEGSFVPSLSHGESPGPGAYDIRTDIGPIVTRSPGGSGRPSTAPRSGRRSPRAPVSRPTSAATGGRGSRVAKKGKRKGKGKGKGKKATPVEPAGVAEWDGSSWVGGAPPVYSSDSDSDKSWETNKTRRAALLRQARLKNQPRRETARRVIQSHDIDELNRARIGQVFLDAKEQQRAAGREVRIAQHTEEGQRTTKTRRPQRRRRQRALSPGRSSWLHAELKQLGGDPTVNVVSKFVDVKTGIYEIGCNYVPEGDFVPKTFNRNGRKQLANSTANKVIPRMARQKKRADAKKKAAAAAKKTGGSATNATGNPLSRGARRGSVHSVSSRTSATNAQNTASPAPSTGGLGRSASRAALSDRRASLAGSTRSAQSGGAGGPSDGQSGHYSAGGNGEENETPSWAQGSRRPPRPATQSSIDRPSSTPGRPVIGTEAEELAKSKALRLGFKLYSSRYRQIAREKAERLTNVSDY